MKAQPVVEEVGLPKRAKLWNRGDKQWGPFYVSGYGKELIIKPGEFVEMSRRAAIEARGMYMGKDVEVSLDIELLPEKGFDEPMPTEEQKAAQELYTCPWCKNRFSDADDLKIHMKKHSGGAAMHKKAVKDGPDTSTSTD